MRVVAFCNTPGGGAFSGLARQRGWAIALQLDHLRVLDKDAARVIDAVCACLGESDPRGGDLARHRAEHAWHAHALEELIAALQAEPVDAPDASPLARGVVARIEARPGDAENALLHLALFEEVLLSAYRCAPLHELPDGVDIVLEEARGHARAHWGWANAQLDAIRGRDLPGPE